MNENTSLTYLTCDRFYHSSFFVLDSDFLYIEFKPLSTEEIVFCRRLLPDHVVSRVQYQALLRYTQAVSETEDPQVGMKHMRIAEDVELLRRMLEA